MFKVVFWKQGEIPAQLVERAIGLNADIAIAPLSRMGTKWYALSKVAVQALTESPLQLPRLNSPACSDVFTSSDGVHSVRRRFQDSDQFEIVE